jgi:predicted phosphohydrolase
MALYGIADLHLSFEADKPMDIFGDLWKNHEESIKKNWINKIKDEDTVLIPGDISWAMRLKEAMVDLSWINALPGRKILLRGNHDYWWTSLSKMNKIFDNMFFLQNNYYIYNDYALCGTRGWTCPNEIKFNEHDQKIYDRELHRLRLSLENAKNDGCKKYIVMTHYPPTNEKFERSGFIEIYEEYNVSKVIYGHLHHKDSFEMGLKGNHGGIDYILASCDYIEFNPVKIID